MNYPDIVELACARPNTLIWDTVKGVLYFDLTEVMHQEPRILLERHIWHALRDLLNHGVADTVWNQVVEGTRI